MQEQPQKPITQTGQTGLISVVNLAKGQSHHVALRRGSVISVASGAVLLISRTRLEDTVLTVQVPLHCGGVYCVTVSGTFEVQALKPACLRQVLSAPLAIGGLTGVFDGWLRGWASWSSQVISGRGIDFFDVDSRSKALGDKLPSFK